MRARGNLSAGVLLFRRSGGRHEFLLAHPGGPFWAKRDNGAWTIVKGEIESDEDPEAAAFREFEEETGSRIEGRPIPLGEVRQSGGKTVIGFALEKDCDPSAIRSNTFEIEWPPRSGRRVSFPEIDRVAWFEAAEARKKINPAQSAFIDRLTEKISGAA